MKKHPGPRPLLSDGWCPKCSEWCLSMHGKCGWCDTRLLDEPRGRRLVLAGEENKAWISESETVRMAAELKHERSTVTAIAERHRERLGFSSTKAAALSFRRALLKHGYSLPPPEQRHARTLRSRGACGKVTRTGTCRKPATPTGRCVLHAADTETGEKQ